MTAAPQHHRRRFTTALMLAGLAAAMLLAILCGPGLWLRLVALVQVQQEGFTRQLAAAVRALRDGDAGALAVLAGLAITLLGLLLLHATVTAPAHPLGGPL